MVKGSIKVFIEIPKGDDRRRHLSRDKKRMLDFGPMKNLVPVNNGREPMAYGFIIGTKSQKDGDELDVLVYSKRGFRIGESVNATPIAMLMRGNEDHKVIAVDGTTRRNIKKWSDVPKTERDLLVRFLSYTTTIKSIKGAKATISYIDKNKIK